MKNHQQALQQTLAKTQKQQAFGVNQTNWKTLTALVYGTNRINSCSFNLREVYQLLSSV